MSVQEKFRAVKGALKWPFTQAARAVNAANRKTFGLVKLTAAYLFFPARIRGMLAVLLVSQMGFPLTGLMFPTAEEYLEQNGLDPAIAKELSDSEIRVRTKDTAGYMHSLLELPTFVGIGFHYLMLQTDYNAYATRGIPLGGYSGYELLNQCHTTMPGNNTTVDGWVRAFTGIPKNLQPVFPVSDHEMLMTIAFHEFRHCDTGNYQGVPMTEGDADYFALKKAADVFDNPEIIPFFIHLRAMAFDDDHNTALYLDHKYRGLRVPSEQLIQHANKEAHEYARIYLPDGDERYDAITYANAYKKVLTHHRHEMSALAARRAEMFIESAQYFAPSLFQHKITPPKFMPVPKNAPIA